MRYGISEQEWAASEAAWPASERAQRYGLASKQRQRGYGGGDYGLASTHSRETNEQRSRAATVRRAANNP